MYGLRSAIAHGRALSDYPDGIELFLKLGRLIEKVVLRTLNYLDNKRDSVDLAYLSEDLRAAG